MNIVCTVVNDKTSEYVFNGSLDTLLCELPLTHNMVLYLRVILSGLSLHIKYHVGGNISLIFVDFLGTSSQL